MGDHYDKERSDAQERLLMRKKAGISDKMDAELADSLMYEHQYEELMNEREAPQINGKKLLILIY